MTPRSSIARLFGGGIARLFGGGIAPVILILAVLALYAQTLGFGFLRYDDPDYTIACAFVKDGLSWANVREAFANLRHGGIWMPLTYVSYMFDVSVLGDSPAAFHLTNVLLHAANAILLWLLLNRLYRAPVGPIDSKAPIDSKDPKDSIDPKDSKDPKDSIGPKILVFLAAAVWALHPQRVEAVAWIAARKELLWCFFALIGLLCWQGRRRFGATLCMALACLAKPTAMVFPFLVLALDLLTPSVDCDEEAKLRCAWSRRVPYLLALFALSLATGLIAIYSQTHPEGMATKELFYASLSHRLVNAVNAVGLYLAQALAPVGIHLDYRAVGTLLPRGWLIGLPLGVLVLIGSIGSLGSIRSLVSGKSLMALWALMALLPTLGIFGSFGEQARADRFWYLPSMALSLGVVIWMRLRACPAPTVRPRTATVSLALLLLVVAFASVAYVRIGDYRNDRTVFARTLACDPHHGRALAHVGEAKCAAGDLEGGIALLRESRTVRPRFDTDAKLAYALMRRGRGADLREIRAVCAEAAAHPERDAKGQALEALGTAELVAGEWESAAQHLSASITAPRRFYSVLDAQLKLGYALHNCGRREEADKLFARVYKSSRSDLAEKAEQAITAVADDPHAVLFW